MQVWTLLSFAINNINNLLCAFSTKPNLTLSRLYFWNILKLYLIRGDIHIHTYMYNIILKLFLSYYYEWKYQSFSFIEINWCCSLIGLEALEKALYCWEDALTAFSSTLSNDILALPSKADAAFTHDVQELLDMGYQIQNHAELLFLDQVTALFRINSLMLREFPEIVLDDSTKDSPVWGSLSFADRGHRADAVPFRWHSSSISAGPVKKRTAGINPI